MVNKKDKIFIIEHLDKELYDWCIIEYKNISKIVGEDNLFFTNIKKEDIKKLEGFGKVITESVSALDLSNAAVLDPQAEKTLDPIDAGLCDYFVFGGILGDDPPRNRTELELTNSLKNAQVFNLGKDQFSTDNAVYVVKKIIEGKSLSSLRFQDTVEIKIDEIESTILPYKYLLIKDKPFICKELIDYIKKQDKVNLS